jgi:hypothetical protein
MRHFIIFFLIIVFSSCHNSENNKQDNLVHIDSIGVNKIDSICKLQLNDYIKSVNGLNANKAIDLTYQAVFKFLKQQYPDEYTIEKVKQTMIEGIIDLKLKMDKKKVKQEFTIDEIMKRINYNGTLIYLVKTTSILKKDKNIIDRFSDETIGISKDEGNNWQYLGKDSIMSPQILRIEFPIQVVNEIFVQNNLKKHQ